MILGALEEVGGTQYLARQAEANPAAFLSLLGRVLPLQVAGDNENPVTYVIRAPSAVESVAEWLRLHAPSDAHEPAVIEAEPTPPDAASPPTAAEPPDAA